MSWHAQARGRRKDSGIFRSQVRMGVAKKTGQVYRDWTFEFITHQTGVSVKRTRYSVSISDPKKHRAAYLRDFTSLDRATLAAKEWIDTAINQRSRRRNSTSAGTIPSVPTVTLTQADVPT